MIHHISKEWLTFLFIEGLSEPLRGMVKVLNPRAMDDMIRAAYDLEPTVKSLREGSANKAPPNQKLLEGPSKAKALALPRSDQLDTATWKKLREEGRCFHCKKAWEPGTVILERGKYISLRCFQRRDLRSKI